MNLEFLGLLVGSAATFAFVCGWLFLRYIPNNKIGIIEKLVSGKGSVKSGLIALEGESGFQPDVLRGGWHVLFRPTTRIHKMPLVTIPQGKIGYVFARDGRPLPASQALAGSVVEDFQDVRAFIKAGGQKGPQRKILREGTYALNLAQFCVITGDKSHFLSLDKSEEAVFQRMAQLISERGGFTPVVIKDADDFVGIVTVHDGPALSEGTIIAPTVGDDPTKVEIFHNNFQEPDRFLKGGGQGGRQHQVLVEGTYYINRLFATVEMIRKTVIEVGTVGVVVSYTGSLGNDLSGEAYKHGELVHRGERGVWAEPLLPGKYAFNLYAGQVISVPTTNFILKWNRGESGVHKYDENLAEVSLITKDAFEPSLPLSVVVHIDYRKAPLVIQRFGDIKRLVEQTLDPMVSAYFKNIGQTRTLIQLLQDRSEIQRLSSEQMKEKFSQYNLELQEVLIGTPKAAGKGDQIETILMQLRARQIAEEQVETYTRQQKASVKERELREAEARARQQQSLTESEIAISISTNAGKADLARAEQQAQQIQALAQAEANKLSILGEGEAKKIQSLAAADAERTAKVGVAQAMAIDEQVRAYGGPKFQLTQQVLERFAQAIETAKVDVVPRILIQGSGNGGADGATPSNGNVMEALLTMMLSDKLGLDAGSVRPATGSNQAKEYRRQLEERVKDIT